MMKERAQTLTLDRVCLTVGWAVLADIVIDGVQCISVELQPV